MNRLIMIGNGFDLAHGLKTSYYDFLFGYFKKSFGVAMQDGIFSDKLIEVKKKFNIIGSNIIDQTRDLEDFLRFYVKPTEFAFYFSGDKFSKTYENQRFEYELRFNDDFFKNMVFECSKFQWVDIEVKYYEYLKKALEIKNFENKKNLVDELNKTLRFLIQELSLYLSQLNLENINKGFYEIFQQVIKKEEIVLSSLSSDLRPSSTMFLNFNYTGTAKLYQKLFSTGVLEISKPIFNNIHGEIDNPENPIVFGYGDEHDSEYHKIESEQVNGFLKFIKSFWYSKTSNYQNLRRFLNTTDFQVFILGHSCGLSDRTLLKMIFEHQNCKSIKIFYHGDNGKNNYTQLTEAISRNFTNKTDWRDKIVPFDKSEIIPQSPL